MLKNYRWLLLTMSMVGLDQWTKSLAIQQLELYQSTPILAFFNLTLMHNTGAAFSLLVEAGGWQRWLFTGIAVLASVIILIWLYKLPRYRLWALSGLSLILGGALANLWDRITLGYVVDFLDFYWGNYHWPAFNVADSAIVIGVSLLIIDNWRKQGEQK
ncbi:MAG: lipoprotein signal peptidase [Gammaproteobacteria bacterium]|jgi:signal peptidase II|nr:lipoprotein signal peptidase [Gammaproteobacteria bacterium]